MLNFNVRQVLVCGIILLFVGASIIPNISGNNEMFDVKNRKPLNGNFDDWDYFQFQDQKTIFNKTEVIDQYTWSVLRYGLRSLMPSSINFGSIHYARPSPGTNLILAAMMSMTACYVAFSVYHENKMDTVLALEDHDVENMIHTRTAYFPSVCEWNSPSIPAYHRESANEMRILGDICLIGDLVGNCYAQTAFNTAVLRMCGFGPEEVFNLGVQDHIVNIVQVEGQWYVLDSTKALSVRLGLCDSLIFEFYDPYQMKMINFLENDKYFINFGTKYPDTHQYQDPYLFNLFSNIEGDMLVEILEEIVPLFNNSALGIPEVKLHEFIENATPCAEMATIAVPYTINDAVGSTVEEKAQSLANLTRSFILNQSGGHIPNQYDRSLYARGLLSVDYPQAYANAAKYAAWTSCFGIKLDTFTPTLDRLITALWIRLCTKNLPTMPEGCVAFADFLYLRHAGSTIDQAIMAYGTLRNMKKDSNLWQPEDIYVLITEDYKGYLAVNATDSWKYLNFGKGKVISNDPPGNIMMAFNEIECLSIWGRNSLLYDG